jgi:hypothetical protein
VVRIIDFSLFVFREFDVHFYRPSTISGAERGGSALIPVKSLKGGSKPHLRSACGPTTKPARISACGSLWEVSIRAYMACLLGMFCRDCRSLTAVSSLRQQWIARRSVLINSSYRMLATGKSQRQGVSDCAGLIDGEETPEPEP